MLVRLDDELGPAFKAAGRRRSHFADEQSRPHEVNLGWHPKAEDALWRPELQQAKRSHTGMWNVRYRNDVKREGVSAVPHLIAAYAPWLRCGTPPDAPHASGAHPRLGWAPLLSLSFRSRAETVNSRAHSYRLARHRRHRE